jgi:hypothetical protein
MISLASVRVPALSACLVSLLALPVPAALAEEKPVASAATEDAKEHVDILSLKRTEGGTVTLRFVLTNTRDSDFSMVAGNIHLVDLAARRSYGAGLTSSSCSAPHDSPHFPSARLLCRFGPIPYAIGGFLG